MTRNDPHCHRNLTGVRATGPNRERWDVSGNVFVATRPSRRRRSIRSAISARAPVSAMRVLRRERVNALPVSAPCFLPGTDECFLWSHVGVVRDGRLPASAAAGRDRGDGRPWQLSTRRRWRPWQLSTSVSVGFHRRELDEVSSWHIWMCYFRPVRSVLRFPLRRTVERGK